MEGLIATLGIMLSYKEHLTEYDLKYPTTTAHDVLYLVGPGPDVMSVADSKRLGELGWLWDEEVESWMSYRYGSR